MDQSGKTELKVSQVLEKLQIGNISVKLGELTAILRLAHRVLEASSHPGRPLEPLRGTSRGIVWKFFRRDHSFTMKGIYVGISNDDKSYLVFSDVYNEGQELVQLYEDLRKHHFDVELIPPFTYKPLSFETRFELDERKITCLNWPALWRGKIIGLRISMDQSQAKSHALQQKKKQRKSDKIEERKVCLMLWEIAQMTQ
jgi:hypothetical protein